MKEAIQVSLSHLARQNIEENNPQYVNVLNTTIHVVVAFE